VTITAISPSDLAIDHEVARVSQSFRFLLDLTPVDVEANRAAFLVGSTREPEFTYRELEDEPEVLRAELASITVGEIDDPTLGHLLRAKHREVGLQLDMLSARGTEEFLPLSIELYGPVAPRLLAQAEDILDRVEVPSRGGGDRGGDDRHVGAEQFVELAEAELAHYRTIEPDIGVHVELRPDASGIMVSGHDLIVGAAATVGRDRVGPLLQHEVGTHLVTYVNGSYQPLRVMAAGLAGHEETQEGLALFAEFLAGGLSASRLRQIAARVVAVHEMVAGQSFVEVHGRLVNAGFSPSSAFTITMRVFRSGGLTKDTIYLRGLVELLGHLADGGELDLFWLGKLSLVDLPLVRDLAERGVLEGPRLLPRFLADPGAASRLEQASGITDPLDLIEGAP
jgi:uncharacterized protein (TIGR02421 family)